MSRSRTDDALLPAAAARGCLLCLLVRNARAGQGAAGIGAPIQVASCMHARTAARHKYLALWLRCMRNAECNRAPLSGSLG